MKNVTITLDEEVLRWARVRAAERDTSVSRMIGEMLKQRMAEEDDYEAAMQRYFLRPRSKMRADPTEKLPKREELYDRPVLRRYERSRLREGRD